MDKKVTINGKKPNYAGLYWVNVVLPDLNRKLAIAEVLDKDTELLCVRTNGKNMSYFLTGDWYPDNKPGWYKKEIFAQDLHAVFDWNYNQNH